MLPQFTRKPVDHPLGYLVAISGLMMQLMSYGIDNSYSIFLQDMHNDESLGNPSITVISLGNSVALGLSPAFGVIAGFLVDRLPPRVMLGASTIMLFSGLWIATFAKSIYAVTFTYCLLASIGTACMLSPGAAATSSWFDRYRGLAMGINFCGGGLGNMIVPPLAGRWVVHYGWRQTFRLMSAFCAIGVVATCLSARRREPLRPANEAAPDAENPKENREPQEDEEKGKETEGPEGIRSLHIHKLTPWELFLTMFTRPFIGNFLCWFVYSWAFFSLIFSFVPYVSSMGKSGTVYAAEEPIPTDVASTVFIFFGAFQIAGSVSVGWIASLTSSEFAYVACATVGGSCCGLLALCRSYIAFAFALSVIGFCTAGIFAVMPALIAEHLYGPNLGFYMGSVFLAGVVGGFCAPPLQAELQQRHNGNYSYVCVIMCACMLLAGAVCYGTLWRTKRARLMRVVGQTKLVETL
ncbi:putative Major Facilitator Superfamily [Trypanosoma vivax]|nr:putative transporter [Trypanosoma vivax]KAH8617010.1 putative Major Facilitator Superfamily [Trypanosoma vivax]